MADRLWKRFERRMSALLGCQRNILSGSCGRSDKTASDTTHPKLFIEIKHYDRTWSFMPFFDKAAILAKREKKVPVLMLGTKGRIGGFMVIHTSDLIKVAEIILENRGTISAEFDEDCSEASDS